MSDTKYRLVAWTENGEVRFSDGILACRSAGCYPPALEDLCEGCREAAGREGGTLEEILYEEGIPDFSGQMERRSGPA